MSSQFAPGDFYIQRFHQYFELFSNEASILIEEIKKKINFKMKQLNNSQSRFIKAYLQAFNEITTVPNFVEAIISFLSLSRSTTLYNIEFHND